MRVGAFVGVWACAIASAAARPASGEERIVLVSGDASLRAAAGDALAPAGMSIVAVEPAATASIDHALGDARGIAETHGATATVWLIPAAEGASSTLVVYDRGVDRVLVRALPYAPPLTSFQAAQTARTIRSMLRALRVTPDLDLAPPAADQAAAIRERAAALPPPASEPDSPGDFWVDVVVGARSAGGSAALAPEMGVAIGYRGGRCGGALVLGFMPSASLAAGEFNGDWSDDSLALVARCAFTPSRRIQIALGAGPALHVVHVAGTFSGGAAGDAWRADPAAHAEIVASYEVAPSTALGVQTSLDGLFRRQRFLDGEAEIFTLPAWQAAAGLVLTVRFL